MKPNGPDAKGTPVEVDEAGRIVKGMGGKFKGEKISEIRKDFVGAKSPSQENLTKPAQKSIVKAQKSQIKLKENHIQLAEPIKVEKSIFGGYRTPDMRENEFIETKKVSVKNGYIVGTLPQTAEAMGWKTVGTVQPKSEKTLKKEKELAEAKAKASAERTENAQAAVAQMRLGSVAAQIPLDKQDEAVAAISMVLNDRKLTPNQRAIQALKMAESFIPTAQDAEWQEDKHPRDGQGRFGSGGNNLNAQGKVNFPELSASEVADLAKTPIGVTADMGQGARQRTVKNWLRENLLGKAVKSSDGKLIQFNRNDSADHIAHDSRRNHLRALAVPHIADVFQNGEAKGKSDPSNPWGSAHTVERVDMAVPVLTHRSSSRSGKPVSDTRKGRCGGATSPGAATTFTWPSVSSTARR